MLHFEISCLRWKSSNFMDFRDFLFIIEVVVRAVALPPPCCELSQMRGLLSPVYRGNCQIQEWNVLNNYAPLSFKKIITPLGPLPGPAGLDLANQTYRQTRFRDANHEPENFKRQKLILGFGVLQIPEGREGFGFLISKFQNSKTDHRNGHAKSITAVSDPTTARRLAPAPPE